MNELKNCSTCGIRLDDNQNSVYRAGRWYGYCDACYLDYTASKYNLTGNTKFLGDDYSLEFDKLRKNRVATSRHKYGPASKNFGDRLVNAIGCVGKCLDKYFKTHNTEYLCDAANYLMFEFMYPQFDDAFFEATSVSAGIDGISIKEMEEMKNEDY